MRSTQSPTTGTTDGGKLAQLKGKRTRGRGLLAATQGARRGGHGGDAHYRDAQSGGRRRCRGGRPASERRSAPRLSSLAAQVGIGHKVTL
jgi:hypothetical protein